MSLRARLDRDTGIPGQLMLSNSDPNFQMASPEHQSEVTTLGTIVDGVQANPRDGYPTNSSAQQACEAVRVLTADQLRSTATDLRNKAWAGVPDGSRPDDPSAGVLAHEQITQRLPQMKERTLAQLYEQSPQNRQQRAMSPSVP